MKVPAILPPLTVVTQTNGHKQDLNCRLTRVSEPLTHLRTDLFTQGLSETEGNAKMISLM